MALLGQQELLEAGPRRRLIVPRGQQTPTWWGVDPGVSRVAVAYARSGGPCVARTASFADLEGGARLEEIWTETERLVADVLRDGWPCPGLVWVEQPSGAQPNPPLSYATGVIMGAIYSALVPACGPVRVETVSSSSWKKVATGYGAHYKPTRKKLGRTPRFEDYGVARWAAANGYAGSSWDEADALGIAEAARREVALEER